MRHSHRSLVLLVTASAILTAVGATVPLAGAADSGYSVARVSLPISETMTADDAASSTVYFAGPAGIAALNTLDQTVTTVSRRAVTGAIALDSSTGTIYAGNGQTAGLLVIDASTGAVTATISLPETPLGLAVDPSTDMVYASQSDGEVVAISGATNMVTGQISTGSGSEPHQLAVDPLTDTIWVAGLGEALWAIDGATNRVTQTLNPFSEPAGSLDQPSGVAVDPVTNRVYLGAGNVAVIDGATGTTTGILTGMAGTRGIAIDPTAGLLYVTGLSGSALGQTLIISLSSGTLTDTVDRGGFSVAADSTNGTAFEAGPSSDPDVSEPTSGWVLTPAAANATSPVITSRSLFTFEVGVGTFGSVQADATPAATYSASSPLPDGLTLASDGTLGGTAAAGTGGRYQVTVTAANGISPAETQAVTIVVQQPPAIAAVSPLTLHVGKPVTVPLTVTGYPPPQVSAAALPAGLALTQTNGGWQLSGTPTTGSGGVYQTRLTASGVAPSASVGVSITVDERPSFVSGNSVSFRTGGHRTFTFRAFGYPVATLSEHGRLPRGLSFRATAHGTAVISGRLARSDRGRTYVIEIRARNGLGSVVQKFRIKVKS